jgi:hypothetical protein
MKKLLIILTSLIMLVSCEVYEEPTYPTLSGEYQIDYVTVEDSSDNSFVPSDTVVLNDLSFPIDTILVGFTKIKFSNDRIFFNPYLNQYSQTEWLDEFFYVTRNYEYHGFGFIIAEINGKTFTFDIVEDGLERIVLRTDNNCFFGKKYTFTLTMVGP